VIIFVGYNLIPRFIPYKCRENLTFDFGTKQRAIASFLNHLNRIEKRMSKIDF
jgi:hypothetical protein